MSNDSANFYNNAETIKKSISKEAFSRIKKYYDDNSGEDSIKHD